jgi:predicted signal transduction protein with EAL and GGDEF domain
VSRGETDVPSLVGKADIAHKTIGDVHRTSIVFYDDKIQSEFLRKKKLESAMSSSLENGDFMIHLQPKFDLSTNKIVGTEALARWQHPTEGLIMPQQFISLFESNGFILELDFYIYEKVCQTLRKWLDAGKTVLPVFRERFKSPSGRSAVRIPAQGLDRQVRDRSGAPGLN